MSTYTDASLIVTPNAKKAGKLYALKGADLDVVRATTATYVGSDGLIKTALANEVRFDYTNGSCPSILIEPQRTNLLTNSDGNLSTYTTNSNVTDATIPINGFTNSIQFGDNSLNRLAYKRNFTPTIGVQYTLSAFIQMNDNSQPILGIIATEGDFSFILNGLRGNINPQVVKIGNTNIYRVSISFVATTTNTQFGVTKYTTQSAKGFKITGIQLEAGSNATSYIPTTSSAVTRNADVISKTGLSNLIGQTQGTIFIDFDWSGNLTSASRLFQINNGTISSDIFLNITSIIGNCQLFINNVGQLNPLLPNISVIKKFILVYTSNSLKMFVNGSLVFDSIQPISFAFLDRLNIGSSNIASERVANMRVNNFMIFKTALTDEQCIALTNL